MGRGDGGIFRRVGAAQEAAPERGEVSLEYGEHWRQRLSVTIIRGRVMVVAAAAAAAAREKGRGGNGETPEETPRHSLG